VRVLYVIDGLGTGGAERSLFEMLPLLAAAGIEAEVATLYARSEGVEGEVRALGVPVHRLTGWRLPGRVRSLRRLLASVTPDLVHATLFDASLVARLATAKRVPLVQSLVNTNYDPQRLRDPSVTRWSLAAVRVLDSVTARFVTHFHAITAAVKVHAVEKIGISPDSVTVVERGRDPMRLGALSAERRDRARAAFQVEPDDEVIVNVGRREFQKGQRFLIESVAMLVATRPRLVLLIAGRDGAASAELDALTDRLGVRTHIRFLGHRPDVPDVLAAADVFVFPSVYEGLGGSILEAMGLGLPIVASDLPALRGIVETDRTAVLIPPGDSTALAAAVAEILDDPHRAGRLGSAARAAFNDRFTAAVSTERMLALYDQVLRRRRVPPPT
jgi:glycosyltransferase involved in cell wall biosynthesis